LSYKNSKEIPEHVYDYLSSIDRTHMGLGVYCFLGQTCELANQSRARDVPATPGIIPPV
jgi:hypothetical protein